MSSTVAKFVLFALITIAASLYLTTIEGYEVEQTIWYAAGAYVMAITIYCIAFLDKPVELSAKNVTPAKPKESGSSNYFPLSPSESWISPGSFKNTRPGSSHNLDKTSQTPPTVQPKLGKFLINLVSECDYNESELSKMTSSTIAVVAITMKENDPTSIAESNIDAFVATKKTSPRDLNRQFTVLQNTLKDMDVNQTLAKNTESKPEENELCAKSLGASEFGEKLAKLRQVLDDFLKASIDLKKKFEQIINVDETQNVRDSFAQQNKAIDLKESAVDNLRACLSEHPSKENGRDFDREKQPERNCATASDESFEDDELNKLGAKVLSTLNQSEIFRSAMYSSGCRCYSYDRERCSEEAKSSSDSDLKHRSPVSYAKKMSTDATTCDLCKSSKSNAAIPSDLQMRTATQRKKCGDPATSTSKVYFDLQASEAVPELIGQKGSSSATASDSLEGEILEDYEIIENIQLPHPHRNQHQSF